MRSTGWGRSAWAPSVRGCPNAIVEQCQVQVTIPLREGAESLNVAAAAAISLQRIASEANRG